MEVIVLTNQPYPRPNFPDSLVNQLWARSAGRCEFRGCNEVLYKDDLTQKQSNLATISHIVAFSPNGSRGDPIRSKQLEKDITNLMLTCKKHGKIIDDKNRVTEYPEELLVEFKKEHELRIRLLTEAKEDAKTHVLVVNVPIGGNKFEINSNQVFQAILPKYPVEEVPLTINLNGMSIPTTTEGFFQVAKETIDSDVQSFLRIIGSGKEKANLSIFGLAPVALLIYLGYLLGDIERADLYQFHRDSQNWLWKEDKQQLSEAEITNQYTLTFPEREELIEGREIAILLSVSNSIKHAQVEESLGQMPIIFELMASKPGFDFLDTKQKLENFGKNVRALFEEIRRNYSQDVTIHVFSALPAPAAIEFGRHIKKDLPAFQLYEYNRSNRTDFPALKINVRAT